MFYKSDNYINSIGINPESKVIVLSDLTPNGSLYFLNCFGWTLKDTSATQLKKLNQIIFDQNPDYFIFTNKDFIKHPAINKYIGDFKGQFNELQIFEVKN